MSYKHLENSVLKEILSGSEMKISIKRVKFDEYK